MRACIKERQTEKERKSQRENECVRQYEMGGGGGEAHREERKTEGEERHTENVCVCVHTRACVKERQRRKETKSHTVRENECVRQNERMNK